MQRIHDALEARRRLLSPALVVAAITLCGIAGVVGAAGVPAADPPQGAELFKIYCASCHGPDGAGSGPMARTLRHAPSDLTQISKKNGGMFPAARVRRVVEGRDVESHGDRDMPVWGDAFKTTGDGRTQASADARIDAIVRYLESIQLHHAQ